MDGAGQDFDRIRPFGTAVQVPGVGVEELGVVCCVLFYADQPRRAVAAELAMSSSVGVAGVAGGDE